MSPRRVRAIVRLTYGSSAPVRVSTLDLFDGRFVLLTGPDGHAWRSTRTELAGAFGPPIATYTVSAGGEVEDPEQSWQECYGIGSTGAVLVRADGYVAWRSQTAVRDPIAELTRALAQVLAIDSPSRMRTSEATQANGAALE